MTAVYIAIFAGVLALWSAHAGWSWIRPGRRDAFGVLLLVGLPIVAVVALVAFAFVHEGAVGGDQPMSPGDHGDQGLGLVFLVMELVALWLVVCALEVVLVPVRSGRRRRVSTASGQTCRET